MFRSFRSLIKKNNRVPCTVITHLDGGIGWRHLASNYYFPGKGRSPERCVTANSTCKPLVYLNGVYLALLNKNGGFMASYDSLGNKTHDRTNSISSSNRSSRGNSWQYREWEVVRCFACFDCPGCIAWVLW